MSLHVFKRLIFCMVLVALCAGCATSAALKRNRKVIATRRVVAAEKADLIKPEQTQRALQLMAFTGDTDTVPIMALWFNLNISSWQAFAENPLPVLGAVLQDAITTGVPAYLGYLAIEELNDSSADITIHGNNNTVGDGNTTSDTDSTDNSSN